MLIIRFIAILLVCMTMHITKVNNLIDEPFDITIIKCIPGGSRSHIIQLNLSNGTISYKVGGFTIKDTLDDTNFVFDQKYDSVKKVISKKQIRKIQKLLKSVYDLSYDEQAGIRDGWENYIFIKDVKKVKFFANLKNNVPEGYLSLYNYSWKLVGEPIKLSPAS